MPQTNYLTNTKSTARRSGEKEKRREIQKNMGTAVKSRKTDKDDYEALTMGVTPKTFIMKMTKMAIMTGAMMANMMRMIMTMTMTMTMTMATMVACWQF